MNRIGMLSCAGLVLAACWLTVSSLRADQPYYTTKSQDCGQNVGATQGRVGLHRAADPQGAWKTKGFFADHAGPMPQTVYDPNFGCYPGNARTIQRYPAFHGYYTRAPYNYRHYSEYPWNAVVPEPRPYPDNVNQAAGMLVEDPGEGSVIIQSDEPYQAPEPSASSNHEYIEEVPEMTIDGKQIEEMPSILE